MFNETTRLLGKLKKLKKSLERYIKLNWKSKVAWLLVEIERLEYLIENGTRQLIVGNEYYVVYYYPNGSFHQKYSIVRLSDNAEHFFDVNSQDKATDAWLKESQKIGILGKHKEVIKLPKKPAYKCPYTRPKLKTKDVIALLWQGHCLLFDVSKECKKDGRILLTLAGGLDHSEMQLYIPKLMLETIDNKTYKFYDHIQLADKMVDQLKELVWYSEQMEQMAIAS